MITIKSLSRMFENGKAISKRKFIRSKTMSLLPDDSLFNLQIMVLNILRSTLNVTTKAGSSPQKGLLNFILGDIFVHLFIRFTLSQSARCRDI